jgi:hypothetical protein
LRNVAIVLKGKKIKEEILTPPSEAQNESSEIVTLHFVPLTMTKNKILKYPESSSGQDDKKRKGNNKKVIKQRMRSSRFTSFRSR